MHTSRMYRATHTWSAAEIPTDGPTWNSHYTIKKNRTWSSITPNPHSHSQFYLNKACNYLPRHHLPVDATDVDARVQASLVVSIHYVAPKCLIGTNATVIRPLHQCNVMLLHNNQSILPKTIVSNKHMIIALAWGPGYPPTGHPTGHFTSFCSKVYSCSIPYLNSLS